MSLSGMNDWQHISHAAITLKKDELYLATHHASIQPKTVNVFSINIKFPRMERKGAIWCKQLASAHIKEKDFSVTHIGFKKIEQGPQLYTCLGGWIDQQWKSCVQQWELKQNNTNSLLKDRCEFICQNQSLIEGSFLTSVKSSKSGHLILGLSDGSLHSNLLKEDSPFESYVPGFWCIVKSNTPDSIKDLTLSPNETHIIYTLESGQISIARATHDTFDKEQVTLLTLQLKRCLFENVDATDLISELVRLGKQPGLEDKPMEILDSILTSYESQHKDQEEDWNIGLLQKAYGFAITTLNRLPDKKIQSINMIRGMQLPTILECFNSSCLNYNSIDKCFSKERVDVEFDFNSFWSLAVLSTWVFDFVKWILHEWDLLMYSKNDQTKESRECLVKLLILIQNFLQFASSAHYQLDHLPESQPVLQRYIKTLKEETPINIDEVITLLNDIAKIECSAKANNRWSALLKSTFDDYAIPELQEVSLKYKEKCAQPCLYIKKEIIEEYDPIRKRKISNYARTNLCIQ
ncbi:hypothetical protein BY458DRAFT_536141 [Sporodiniella umbellata]|nr:hypothetical protein BY458DRAFT_536141 [Sporodiniella umbellata]